MFLIFLGAFVMFRIFKIPHFSHLERLVQIGHFFHTLIIPDKGGYVKQITKIGNRAMPAFQSRPSLFRSSIISAGVMPFLYFCPAQLHPCVPVSTQLGKGVRSGSDLSVVIQPTKTNKNIGARKILAQPQIKVSVGVFLF